MTLRFLIFLLCTTKKIYNHESTCVLDRHTFLNSIKMLCVPSFLLAVSVSWYQSTGVRFALLKKMWPCFCFLLPPYMKSPHFIYLSSSGYDYPWFLCSVNALVETKALFHYIFLKCILKVTEALVAMLQRVSVNS